MSRNWEEDCLKKQMLASIISEISSVRQLSSDRMFVCRLNIVDCRHTGIVL